MEIKKVIKIIFESNFLSQVIKQKSSKFLWFIEKKNFDNGIKQLPAF